MNTKTVTAQNCSLFEIDAELEEAFDQLQEEREITGSRGTSASCEARRRLILIKLLVPCMLERQSRGSGRCSSTTA